MGSCPVNYFLQKLIMGIVFTMFYTILCHMNGFINLKKLNRDELFDLRKKIVRLKKKGYSGIEIEELTCVRANRISEIWRRYLDKGAESLRPGSPGRKAGERTLLPSPCEHEIRRFLIDATPDTLGLPYSLWTRQIAADFIRREYGIRLSPRTMTNYFKKWGFICRTPQKTADQQDDMSFLRFMNEDYPVIVRRAVSENVGIYWFNETWVGKEPRQNSVVCQQRIKMAAAVTARGTARFMFFEGEMTQQRFITFVKRLIRYADRKVFLIAADLKAFSGGKVRTWLKDNENRIEIFYHPTNKKA